MTHTMQPEIQCLRFCENALAAMRTPEIQGLGFCENALAAMMRVTIGMQGYEPRV
jgi:hypothetical protein